MRQVVDQLERSLDHPVYFPSLFTALAVPDIAGALDSHDGEANGDRYAAWHERGVRPQFGRMLQDRLLPEMRGRVSVKNPLTADACYRFRCSMLHQGSTQHPMSAYSRIIFVEPGASTNVLHYNTINDALNIDLRLFCREVV